MAGKKLNPEIVAHLLEKRRTPVLEGFRSRSGKVFNAALVLWGKKVAFEFQDGKENGSKEDKRVEFESMNRNGNVIRVRVESGNSGAVHLFIEQPINFVCDVSYGLVSSRLAECLGCITAARLVKHRLKDVSSVRLIFSLNNLDFSRYLLRERSPRDVEVKKAVGHLWGLLQEFAGWEAQFVPTRKPRLRGGPRADKFPRGVFPWLDISITNKGDGLEVKLPDCPDVHAQFRASIFKAVPGEGGCFNVPASAEQALLAWLNAVKGVGGSSPVS
jgi:hypothetical protein